MLTDHLSLELSHSSAWACYNIARESNIRFFILVSTAASVWRGGVIVSGRRSFKILLHIHYAPQRSSSNGCIVPDHVAVQIFDAMPGDIFALRNAGNTCTHAEGPPAWGQSYRRMHGKTQQGCGESINGNCVAAGCFRPTVRVTAALLVEASVLSVCFRAPWAIQSVAAWSYIDMMQKWHKQKSWSGCAALSPHDLYAYWIAV